MQERFHVIQFDNHNHRNIFFLKNREWFLYLKDLNNEEQKL